jgi:16S rRNA processing protein RimM
LTKRFVTAITGRPFGIGGFLRVTPLSGECAHLAQLHSVTARYGSDERTLAVEEWRSQGDSLLVKFVGVDTPEAARNFVGAELIVPREYAAPLAKNEFYIEDLKGLSVQDTAENTLGNIVDVIGSGGGFLVEVALLNGERHLVPFRDKFFGEISVENGTATLLEMWILA